MVAFLVSSIFEHLVAIHISTSPSNKYRRLRRHFVFSKMEVFTQPPIIEFENIIGYCYSKLREQVGFAWANFEVVMSALEGVGLATCG